MSPTQGCSNFQTVLSRQPKDMTRIHVPQMDVSAKQSLPVKLFAHVFLASNPPRSATIPYSFCSFYSVTLETVKTFFSSVWNFLVHLFLIGG